MIIGHGIPSVWGRLYNATRISKEEFRRELAEFKRLYGINNAMLDHTESIAAFRFRLREASRAALDLGDKLLAMSQDATEPNASQLKELRDLEGSLDVCLRYRLPDLKSGVVR